jgi:hypothetical protein
VLGSVERHLKGDDLTPGQRRDLEVVSRNSCAM